MKREELSERQMDVLDYWESHWFKKKCQPRDTEIARSLGISRERARQIKVKLIEYGFLKKVVEKGEFIIKLARKDEGRTKRGDLSNPRANTRKKKGDNEK